jgi:hypothetical protein
VPVTARRGHLVPVPDCPGVVVEPDGRIHLAHPEEAPPPAPRRLVLKPSGALDLAEAEAFLVELPAAVEGASAARLAYLLGVAEGHLTNLTDLVRAVVKEAE